MAVESPSLLVVDDDVGVGKVIQRVFGPRDIAVTVFDDPRKLVARIQKPLDAPCVLLSDIQMPHLSGHDVLAECKQSCPDLPVILMTGIATLESAIEAIRLGAYDYLVKPFKPAEALTVAVDRALAHHALVASHRMLEREVSTTARFREMVGTSPGIRRLQATIASVAPTDSTVLVRGESGTGKELVARAIHQQSKRNRQPFVAFNCAALSESMLESELFGHVRGAFTGAVSNRHGLFEEASGGTLFLDEVGELSLATQARLLRVLQEREIRPVGSDRSRSVDVRLVAATHRDLKAFVREGGFREDLLYRLDVIGVDVPPLRDRMEDVALLAQHFAVKHASRLERPVPKLSTDLFEQLARHPWPGNVRELENTMERVVVLGEPTALSSLAKPTTVVSSVGQAHEPSSSGPTVTLKEARDAFEIDYLKSALKQADGNVAEAARLAGVDRSNLRRLMKRHGLQ